MRLLSGSEFRDLVRGAGLTVKQICADSGISEQTACNWANKDKDIKKNTYEELLTSYEKLTGYSFRHELVKKLP